MTNMTKRVAWVLGVLIAAAVSLQAATIRFSGHEWTVRSGHGGPGPNAWEEKNVWLDDEGHLHLKITSREGKWSCAEVTTRQRLGFGRYEFQVLGGIDRLDDNVVLGLFNYPTPDVGEDATHEIDIEFARWGKASNPMGNYTVWPVEKTVRQTSKAFPFTLAGPTSTHRFEWNSEQVACQSWQGLGDAGPPISSWPFKPADAPKRISKSPMPVHINLWLFQGKPPKDQKEVEVVVLDFKFST